MNIRYGLVSKIIQEETRRQNICYLDLGQKIRQHKSQLLTDTVHVKLMSFQTYKKRIQTFLGCILTAV